MESILSESREAVTARLKLTREALGLNQAEWSRRLGIDNRTWNNYERGVSRISLEIALDVCKIAGVSLDWIYRGDMSTLPRLMHDKIVEQRDHVADVPAPRRVKA